MRTIFLLFFLVVTATGCAGRMEAPADTSAAGPQPGTVSARMNGEYVWYGTVRSRTP